MSVLPFSGQVKSFVCGCYFVSASILALRGKCWESNPPYKPGIFPSFYCFLSEALLTFMIQDKHTTPRATIAIQVSKNLERISDHVKGIADMVVYRVTSKSVHHEERPEEIKEISNIGHITATIIWTSLPWPCSF